MSPARPSAPTNTPTRAIESTPDGGWVEKWTLARELHREDGPASITYRPDGSIARETWYLRGGTHREDGPSDVHYGTDGAVTQERWAVAGECSRIDGPALIDHERGITAWYYEGILHRLNGPAYVEAVATRPNDPDEFFYLNGTLSASPETYRAKIRSANAKEFGWMVEGTEFAPLLEDYAPEQIQAEIVAGLTTRSGVEQVLEGAPREWVLAWEEGQS